MNKKTLVIGIVAAVAACLALILLLGGGGNKAPARVAQAPGVMETGSDTPAVAEEDDDASSTDEAPVPDVAPATALADGEDPSAATPATSDALADESSATADSQAAPDAPAAASADAGATHDAELAALTAQVEALQLQLKAAQEQCDAKSTAATEKTAPQRSGARSSSLAAGPGRAASRPRALRPPPAPAVVDTRIAIEHGALLKSNGVVTTGLRWTGSTIAPPFSVASRDDQSVLVNLGSSKLVAPPSNVPTWVTVATTEADGNLQALYSFPERVRPRHTVVGDALVLEFVPWTQLPVDGDWKVIAISPDAAVVQKGAGGAPQAVIAGSEVATIGRVRAIDYTQRRVYTDAGYISYAGAAS